MGTDLSTKSIAATLLLGIALASASAFAQSAMTPGGGAMTPRAAPAPQAPAAPQTPTAVAPPVPVAIPNAPGPVPGDATKFVRKAGDRPTEAVKTPDGGTQPGTTGGKQGVNVDSSNRDHIDQDAQTDIKKGLTTSGGNTPTNGTGGTGGGRYTRQ